MRRIKNDSPEKAAARLERFLAKPPGRIDPSRVAQRKIKSIRTGKPPGVLKDLCNAQKWKCSLCNRPLRWRPTRADLAQSAATLEHSLPVSRGGTNARSNLSAACLRCNQAKGSMTPEEYRAATRLRDRQEIEPETAGVN